VWPWNKVHRNTRKLKGIDAMKRKGTKGNKFEGVTWMKRKGNISNMEEIREEMKMRVKRDNLAWALFVAITLLLFSVYILVNFGTFC